MTPAIKLLDRSGVTYTLHPYEHDPNHRSYGVEAAEKLGISPDVVFKTLVVTTDTGQLTAAVVPVSRQVNLKWLATHCQSKKLVMAAAADVERASGYVLGGVSPLGLKRCLPMVIDTCAQALDRVTISAGKRGLDLSLSPADLIRLTGAQVAEISTPPSA